MITQALSRIRPYYELTKPRVTYGNVLTVVAGFLFASYKGIDFGLLVAVTIGMTLVIASACALNNFLDQDIDARMARTKKRPSVTGVISGKNMIIFSALLGFIGLGILCFYTNIFVIIASIVGFIVYVLFYGALSKRMSIHGTLVGSVSGAVPILTGYMAAAGTLDLAGVLLFAILFLWQMPEFYSIAIYRQKEYAAAGVPVISVVKGIPATVRQILAYTITFVIATLLLGILGYAGFTYGAVMAALGVYWIRLAAAGLKTKYVDDWARSMFHFSLTVLLVFCFLISVEPYLP